MARPVRQIVAATSERTPEALAPDPQARQREDSTASEESRALDKAVRQPVGRRVMAAKLETEAPAP